MLLFQPVIGVHEEMPNTNPNKPEQRSVLIVDPMSLRRAQIAAFLQPWAERTGVTLVEVQFWPEQLVERSGIVMTIVNVGSSNFEDAYGELKLTEVFARLPDIPIVIMSDREDSRQVMAALQAGARSFIPTTIEPHVALQALTFILSGGWFYPPTTILEERIVPDGGMFGSFDAAGSDERADSMRRLTDRQTEVHRLLRQGMSNKMIARELNMQESTVKIHVRHIMRKLRAANRTQAALMTPTTPSAPLGTSHASGRPNGAGQLDPL